jgi:hypothetical protein
MKFLYFFLFLWVTFALLDPDPATQINADPDPQPCLKVHVRRQHQDNTHTEEQGGNLADTFRCALCQAVFSIDESLNVHLRQKHPSSLQTSVMMITPPPQPWCEECNKPFDTKQLLKSHQTAVHIEKRLECPECGKRFLYPAHLRDHARSHDKAKPYECEVCRCRFSTRTHAYAHVRSVHAALGTVVEVKGGGVDGLPKHRRPGSRCKKAGLRIRIHFIRIRIQHFRLNTVSDPDLIRIQGLNDQKLKKKISN